MPKLMALAAPAHLARHVLHGHAEHLRGRYRVDVETLVKGLAQLRDVGDMREQPQFDLRIIRGDEFAPGRRDKGAPDLAALLVAHGNVLDVGIGG